MEQIIKVDRLKLTTERKDRLPSTDNVSGSTLRAWSKVLKERENQRLTPNTTPARTKAKSLATARVSINNLKVVGWKVVRGYDDKLIVYPPSTMSGHGTYKPLVNLDQETMDQISSAVISAYEQKADEDPRPRSKDPPKQIKMHYSLLRHYYSGHKRELTALRIYLTARNALDIAENNCFGRASLNDLCRLLRMDKKYLRYICRRHPQLFYGYGKNFVYYRSLRKIFKAHHLNLKKCLIREERLSQKFLLNLKSNKALKCYITKATMEKDLGESGFTKGRISFTKAAEELFISPKTAFDNIKKSDAVRLRNIITYPRYRFSNLKDFHIWIEMNQDLVVDKTINDKVGENPGSYFAKDVGQDYLVLARRRPNIYKNTAVRQIRGSGYRKAKL